MGHASTHAADLGTQNIQLPAMALGFRKIALAVAVVGLGGGAAVGYTGAFGTDAAFEDAHVPGACVVRDFGAERDGTKRARRKHGGHQAALDSGHLGSLPRRADLAWSRDI